MPSHHTVTGAISLEQNERYEMRSDTFWLMYGTPSGSGKYIRFGLRTETGAERTVVDIFDIVLLPLLTVLLLRYWDSVQVQVRGEIFPH